MHRVMNGLDSAQLDAFSAVARLGNVSAAAKELHLTQPALSRRIQGLEATIGTTLFVRGPAGMEMTEAGRRLSQYVQSKRSLEAEMMHELSRGKCGGYAGVLRIAGYSSVLHHIVAPSIAPFLRKNPSLQLEFFATQAVRPFDCVSLLLQRSQVDFIVGSYKTKRADIEAVLLGHQKLVAIESPKFTERSDTYLDTRAEDPTTEEFFAEQKQKPVYERTFLHDEEGILNGVVLGMGRAVVIDAVVPCGFPVRRVPGLKPVKQALYLMHRKQSVYSKLFQEARGYLLDACGTLLDRCESSSTLR